jgi:hypothetical protein
VRRQLARAAPAVKRFLALGRLWDNIKKPFGFLNDMINNPIGWFIVTSLVAAGVLPTAVTNYLGKKPVEVATKTPGPPKAEPKSPEPPKQLTPVVPEKPKPPCVSFKGIRDALADAPDNIKRYKGRISCSWYLTVATEPVQSGNVWRVSFQTQQGVRVEAELQNVPALQEGDVVQVGGVIGDYRAPTAFETVPTIILQRAWIQRR